MKIALDTAAYHSDCYKSLHLHLNNKSPIITARNVLITHIISDSGFDPKDPNDLLYVFNIWYNAQWDLSTTQRFMNDLDQLISKQWPTNINIPYCQDLAELSTIWDCWKSKATQLDSEIFSNILKQR